MSETKHTPGPWRAAHDDTDVRLLDEEGNWIAECKMWEHDQNVANANHIVRCVNAHDDMLEALEAVQADDTARLSGPVWDKVRAALKKARGEK